MSNNNQREVTGKEPGPTARERMQMQTIEAYIIPIQVMDEIKRKLRKLTIDDGEVLLQTLNAIRPQAIQQQVPANMMPEAPGEQ